MANCPFYSLLQMNQLAPIDDDCANGFDVTYQESVTGIACMGADCQLWRDDDCVINKIYDGMGDSAAVLAAVEEVTASVSEVNSSVSEVNTSVSDVNSSVSEVNSAVEKGNEISEKISESSEAIKKYVSEELDEWLKEVVGESAEEDGSIIQILQLFENKSEELQSAIRDRCGEILALFQSVSEWADIVIGGEDELDSIGSIISQLIHVNRFHWDNLEPGKSALVPKMITSSMSLEDITIAGVGVYGRDFHIAPDKFESIPTGETGPDGQPVVEEVEVYDPEGQKPRGLVGLENGGLAMTLSELIDAEKKAIDTLQKAE